MEQDAEQPMAPIQASLPQKPVVQPHVQQQYAALQQQPTPLPQVCALLSRYSVTPLQLNNYGGPSKT